MAHIAKYKGRIVRPYARSLPPRCIQSGSENIDPTQTKGNYTLGLDDRDGKVRAMNGIEPNWATVEGALRGSMKPPRRRVNVPSARMPW